MLFPSLVLVDNKSGLKKTRVFLKKAQPSGFLGVLLGFWVFLDMQEK